MCAGQSVRFSPFTVSYGLGPKVAPFLDVSRRGGRTVMTEQDRDPAFLGLLRFLARSGLTLALGSGWLSPANAATVFDLRDTTIAGTGTYDAQGSRDADRGIAFGHYYSRTTSASSIGTTASMLDSHPIIAGPGLTGALDSTTRLLATLSTDGFRQEYDTALADGGEYDSVLTARDGGGPSPVPLPPAILLLGSALAGLVLISRRRATEAPNRP
jgi:hypothetical protein